MDYKDKDYHKQKSREHYQKYKQKYNERNTTQRERSRQIMLEAKRDGCIVCGEKEVSCLDFHHLHSKDMLVSQMLARSDEKLKAEIAKCVVLCANCHRKHHAGVLDIGL